MRNFGRGMWRRIGDFDKINTPTFIKAMEKMAIEQQFYEIQTQKEIDAYRRHILNQLKLQYKNKTGDDRYFISPEDKFASEYYSNEYESGKQY